MFPSAFFVRCHSPLRKGSRGSNKRVAKTSLKSRRYPRACVLFCWHLSIPAARLMLPSGVLFRRRVSSDIEIWSLRYHPAEAATAIVGSAGRPCGKVLPLRSTRHSRFRSRSWRPDACPIGHPVGVEELEPKSKRLSLPLPRRAGLTRPSGRSGYSVGSGRAGLSGEGVTDCFTTSIGP